MPSGLEAVDRIVRGFLSMVVESLNVDRDSLRHITHHIVNVFLQLTPHTISQVHNTCCVLQVKKLSFSSGFRVRLIF